MAPTLDITQNLGLSVLRGYSDMTVTNMCGFIVYGREHANVRKVLKDKDYWDAFDEISGANWPIFIPLPLDQKSLMPSQRNYGMGQSDGTSFMVGTYMDTIKTEQILKLFGLTDSNEAPCFVLFAWNDNNELRSEAYKIPDTSVDDVYNTLKKVIEAISSAEKKVLPEYKRSERVYGLALQEIEQLKFNHKIRRIAGPLKNLFDLIAGSASIKSAW